MRACCTTTEHDPCAEHGHDMQYADGKPDDQCDRCGLTQAQIDAANHATEIINRQQAIGLR